MSAAFLYIAASFRLEPILPFSMKQILAYLTAMVLLLGVAGCTGYPDGPSVSLTSAVSKLSTTWRIKQAIQNGTDITSEYDNEFFEFEEEGDFELLESTYDVSIPPFTMDTVLTVAGQGSWQFRNQQSQIELLYQVRVKDPFNSSVSYTRTFNELWTIDRLTKEEFWLSDDSTSLKLEFFVP